MKRASENPLIPAKGVVIHNVRETANVHSLSISLPHGEMAAARPGQFNMLGLPGIGESAISFSALPAAGGGFIHTIRIAGNVTRALCRLKKGDSLSVRGPFGSGWPLERARGKDIVVAAGGIGMAPLKPVIEHCLKNRSAFGRLFLLYGMRSEEDILYREELKSWSKGGKMRVYLSADEKPGKNSMGVRQGLVTELMDDLDVAPDRAAAFICGPEIMMRFVARGLIIKGHAAGNIYVSMERRMKCGAGHCGHCQIGAKYVCKDGPVFAYSDIRRFADTLL